MRFERRRAVSNVAFGVTVAVLLVVAASGFLLYATRPAMMETTTQTMSETMSETATAGMAAPAIALVPAHGQMISDGWVIIAPLGNGSYAVTVHADGLEAPSMGNYIVEAAQSSGAMATVPIAGSNATLSEFETDSHGTGQYFVVMHQDPASVFESVSLVYLPGMEMQNAMVVATAPLTMSAH